MVESDQRLFLFYDFSTFLQMSGTNGAGGGGKKEEGEERGTP